MMFRSLYRRVLWFALAVVLPIGGSVFAQEVMESNMTEGCVESYDPSVDYFPNKVEVEYAVGFEVEYFNHYKVVTVLTPWPGAETTFTYVLVQCGTPAPEDTPEGAVVLEAPVQRFISMSTTYLPHVEALGALDQLVGLDSAASVFSEDIRARFDNGELVEVGSGAEVNVEQVIESEADLVMTFGSGSPDFDAQPVLAQAGVNVAINAEWVETTPLGRAEWIKYTSLFFNREAEANAFFADVATRYNELVALTADVEARPTVFNNGLFGDTWYISGGNSFRAQLFKDAGAEFLWSDDETTGSIPLSFEAVFERAQSADFWVNPGFGWRTLDEGLAEDERYAEFAAFQSGEVYSPLLRVNEQGVNDFNQGDVIRPDLVLADLIAIFHPELLPDHEFVYYLRAEPLSGQ